MIKFLSNFKNLTEKRDLDMFCQLDVKVCCAECECREPLTIDYFELLDKHDTMKAKRKIIEYAKEIVIDENNKDHRDIAHHLVICERMMKRDYWEPHNRALYDILIDFGIEELNDIEHDVDAERKLYQIAMKLLTENVDWLMKVSWKNPNWAAKINKLMNIVNFITSLDVYKGNIECNCSCGGSD